MPNQTLIVVPTDLDDTETLQWFLTRLVEELDIILGYRGERSDTLASLAAAIKELQNE